MAIYIDFEFSSVKEKYVSLVCCCLYNDKTNTTHSFWLFKNIEEQVKLKTYLKENKEEIFISYVAVAEGRSFISLYLDPTEFKWMDLFLEWRCLTNHNNKLIVGNHYIDGKIKYIPEPKNKWDRTSEDEGYRLKHSLAEATYRLTGEIRDVEHKDRMRDLIISNPSSFSNEEKVSILKYCLEDVIFLPKIYERIIEEYKSVLYPKDFMLLQDNMLYRGAYAALTAIRESEGYPIDVTSTRNFSTNVPLILDDCMREINYLFPDIKPFRWDKNEHKFKWNQKTTKIWVEKTFGEDWKKTDPTERNPDGQISLALESWEQKFHFRHSYPKDNFGAQILRYLKLKQALSGFAEGKNNKSFWDFVGTDGRVRPYMNIYGAQSGRSQPASSGFLFLKPAWCRALMVPAPGKAIVSIDYGSEEFFISALMSKDKNMINAYLSGDVYLAFGKSCGMIPKEGTKSTHKYERDLCKSTVLGLSYKMSKYGLANKLSQDMGKEFTTDEAQELIDLFYEAYPDFKEWQDTLIYDYENGDIDYIDIGDGFYCFGNNPNARSVANVPIQGMGSCIMRKADFLCHENGLYAPFTLHDALYIEIDSHDLASIDIFYTCMKEGFAHFFPDQREIALQIRLDAYAWSLDYEKDSELITPSGIKIDCSNLYVDERSISEHDQFSKYFNPGEFTTL